MIANTVFITVAMTMLANSIVFAIVYRELPPMLRASGRYWQFGTLMITTGCSFLAFGDPLPQWLTLTCANGMFVFGLTAYRWCVLSFDGRHPQSWEIIPAIVTTALIFWFSAIFPDFRTRLFVVSVVWLWLMVSCANRLFRLDTGNASLSRKILGSIFALVAAYVFARLTIFFYLGASRDFSSIASNSLLNIISAMSLMILPITGTTAFLLMCSDRLKRQLEQAAFTDYLTGLPNRRSLVRSGEERFAKASSQGGKFSVAVLDIDAFKSINDRYGHEAGDHALIEVASLLRDTTRAADLIARSGGEEFVVLLSGVAAGESTAIVERMRLAIEKGDFGIGGQKIPLTISAGLADYRAGDRGFEDILRRADQSLYGAKSEGRNRVTTVPSPQ